MEGAGHFEEDYAEGHDDVPSFEYLVPPLEVADTGELPDVSGLDVALEPTREGPIEDTTELLKVFGDVQEALPAAQIPAAFNAVYMRLTERIHMATDGKGLPPGTPEEGRIFERPEDVLHTTGEFGDLYFDPLRKMVQHHQGDPEAWDQIRPGWQLALAPNMLDVKPGLAFLAGMTKHIRGDLAVALHRSGVDERYHPDYTKVVQAHIKDTTDELAPTLMPGHPVLRTIMKGPVVAQIGRMREEAWDNSRLLNEAATRSEAKAITDGMAQESATHIQRLQRFGGALLRAAELTEKIPFGLSRSE